MLPSRAALAAVAGVSTGAAVAFAIYQRSELAFKLPQNVRILELGAALGPTALGVNQKLLDMPPNEGHLQQVICAGPVVFGGGMLGFAGDSREPG